MPEERPRWDRRPVKVLWQTTAKEKPPVSEGPVPKNWREALPFLIWGVLIFACGFEGIASLLHAEWLQAVLGLGGMFGLTAMLIHWARIRDNFADIRWLMGAIMVALVVAALSPYVEQHRWPFVWQFATPVPPAVVHDPPTAKDIAAAAGPLIEKALSQAEKQTDELRDHFALLQQSLEDMKHQRDAAEAEAERLRVQLGVQATQQIPAISGGPINWTIDGQLVVGGGTWPDVTVGGVFIQGKSTESIGLKEAYIVSGMTGHREDLKIGLHTGLYPVDKVDIPAGAAVQLELDWKPPLSAHDFLDQWVMFTLFVVYSDGTTFQHQFDQAFVTLKLKQYIPDALPGPRPSLRTDK
jgi:hypothetical protein